MTLLAPGAMLLAAALAVPVLAAFYLLKLRRRPMRVTSTMLWDQAARDLEVNVPFRWIRPSWLLLLHALILAALLIAIGRPALSDGEGGAGRVFILIDRSASMNAPGDQGGASRLSIAKAEARALVGTLADGAQPPEVTVIAFAADAAVVGPPARDAGSINSMIDAIEPTDQPGDPAVATELVRSLTTAAPRDSDETDDARSLAERAARAVVFTDGGDLTTRTLSAGTTPVRVQIVGDRTLQSLGTRNIGIVGFAADREIEDPESVRVFVRLLNAGATDASVPLIVRLDGEAIDRKGVTIPAATPAGPGERAESVRLSIPEGGVLTVSIDRADALGADNAVHAILPPVRRPAVLVVVPDAPADAAAPRERTDAILLDVLDAIGTAGVRVIERRQFERNASRPAEDFGLVVFDRVRPVSMPRVPSLSFGAPVELGGQGVPQVVRAAERGRTPVLAWDRDHPVMRDAVLDTIFVGDRLIFPEDDEDLNGSDDGTGDPDRSRQEIGREIGRTTLARGATGPLILALNDGGVRRIATAFSLDQTNWPVHFSFPIFVLSAFDFLVPNTDAAAWSETRDEIVLDPPRSASREPIEVTLEGPVSKSIRWDPARGDGRLPIGRLDRAGLYTLRTNGTATPLPVNLLSPAESAVRVGSVGAGGDDGAPIAGRGLEIREIWRWFVLAAGVGLLLEWLVFTLRSRA